MATDEAPVIGRALRAERERMGITQAELAARMGHPQGYVTRWERGVRGIRPQDLAAAEKAMGLPMGTVLRSVGWVDPVGDTRAAIEADLRLAEPWRSMALAAYDLARERSA